MADVQPFRAVRYSGAAGALADLVAPPYDAVGPEERAQLFSRSPYNVVHVTLPETADEAGRLYREWLSNGVLERDESPAVWFVAERYRGRELHGVVVSLGAEPYSTGVVLPHEHTNPRIREERLRLLEATGVQLEPIFLLVDGPIGIAAPGGPPDLVAPSVRLWRLAGSDPRLLSTAREFLIADGHHRYESALDYGVETRVMALVVSAHDPGLEVRPTHRLFRRRPDLALFEDGEEYTDLRAALAQLGMESQTHSAAVAYRAGRIALIRGAESELDVELVDRFGLDGIDYTWLLADATDSVDRGDADLAFIVRPPRIQDVFARARKGERLPPKSTFFRPKPLSGLLFHPVEP